MQNLKPFSMSERCRKTARDIKRHMMALAIKDKDDEWAKKYFDKDTGVEAIRSELSDK